MDQLKMTLTAPEKASTSEPEHSSADSPAHDRASRPLGRSPWAWLVAVVLLGVLGGIAAGLYVRGDGASNAKQARATGLSAGALGSWAATAGHPVYWAGPEPGYRYELTHTTDGRIYIRYLPAGVPIGAAAPDYLTVGTYPVSNALATVRAIGSKSGGSLIKLTAGGWAAVDPDHPLSTYIAYPGSGYEVEVYDPSPGVARRVVTSGGVGPVGSATAAVTPVKPHAVSIADLRALAASSGHAIYWAGKQAATTNELSELSGGGIFVRYLPAGVRAGDPHPFSTVATYPVQGAYAAVEKIASRAGATRIKVADGGIAVIDPAHPDSVYLAYPGGNVEVEVFDPSAGHARRLVASGAIVPVV
jgi:hypothetical protein